MMQNPRYKSISAIVHTPKVPRDEDLARIYQQATFFAYPSIFEGFGIPVLEALISRTPVLTSNLSSLPEAAGPSSLLVDPENQQEINEKIDRLWQSAELRTEMSDSGYSFAQHFKDKNVAQHWNQLYHSLKR